MSGGGDEGGGTQTVYNKNEQPAYVEAAAQKNLEIADQIAARPYTPYGGQRIAGYNQDQTQAFDAIRNAQGGAQPFFNQAGQTYQQVLQPNFLQGQIQQFQNPYQQQVIDNTLSGIERNRQLQQNNLQSQAVSQRAFGGARQQLANTENTRNFAQLSANTEAQLRQQGFSQASDLARANAGLQLDAAGKYAGLGTEQQRQNYADISTQQALGQTLQSRSQQELDFAYKQFLEQQNYPLQQLALRQAALGTTPVPLSSSTTSPINQTTPNFLGSALGGAALGAGVAGQGNEGYGAAIGGLLGAVGSRY